MSRHAKRKSSIKNTRRPLLVELLEDRSLPSCTSISGFVYFDANNNGIFDPSETPIANSQIELRDAGGVVVGSTTTDANGHYVFDVDMTNPSVESTLTKTVTFDETQTNFTLNRLIDQFDPSLGTLESIEIQHAGSITSEIQVENYSTDSVSDISGTVSGTLTLTGPGGVNNTLNISGYAGSFHASKYDGITDFNGASGESFGQQTADSIDSITLTGADMDPYIGTGQVQLTEQSLATSNATGGGNLDVRVRSTAQSAITVIYHYRTFDCLAPGEYTIVQTPQPDDFLDGKESKDGVVDPNSIGTDQISITLGDVDLVNNNFGELKQTQLSGHVWHDANNDGVRDASEDPISGVSIQLTGPTGTSTTVTDDNGFYSFTDLLPGTYTIKETQPDNYLDGKDNEGTTGGIVVQDPAADQIQSITLQSGDNSENNDFGELKPASIAGHVFFDANNNGIFDSSEQPISGAKVTLTGFDDSGPISRVATTNSSGEYLFDNLLPGTYALTETQPAGYSDGKDTIGTPGGTTANDAFSDILLNAGVNGVNNDFGEVKPDVPGTPLPKTVKPLGMVPIINKGQLTTEATLDNWDATFRGQMTFSVGTYYTLTGGQTDWNQIFGAVTNMRNGASQSTIVQQMWATDAHRIYQINSAYQTVLHRAPTAAERASALHDLKTGTTQLALMENLYVSPAFQALHPTTEGLATALYQGILNVTPGTQSLDALVQSMGNDPLQDVVHGLLTSDASLSNMIDDAYRFSVRRAATSAEVQRWLPALKAGTMTIDQLTQRLLASQEFYQLAYNSIH